MKSNIEGNKTNEPRSAQHDASAEQMHIQGRSLPACTIISYRPAGSYFFIAFILSKPAVNIHLPPSQQAVQPVNHPSLPSCQLVQFTHRFAYLVIQHMASHHKADSKKPDGTAMHTFSLILLRQYLHLTCFLITESLAAHPYALAMTNSASAMTNNRMILLMNSLYNPNNGRQYFFRHLNIPNPSEKHTQQSPTCIPSLFQPTTSRSPPPIENTI